MAVVPVPVDVNANTRASSNRLSILSPHSGRGLRVDESIRVDDRQDVKVVIVNNLRDRARICIIVEKGVRDIFVNHGRDPFSGMHGPVENHRRLFVLSRLTIDVDTRDGAPLVGLS